MATAINSVFGQLLFAYILPDYRASLTTSAETQQAIPGGVLGIVIVIFVIVGAISTVIFGSFWGFIGAAFSQLSIFRPKDADYADEY